ncbi:metal-dependent hydrolase [Brachybacterium endophyticum]|uniref:Metal-dependent hydrolase n=1 Tax=Brachybacterium endophyticum TaxID=2182385 RepID=A0A2U2RLY1_9MICO|nr:M48 family metallopeptidase [Brachybacterium endophyticum]PWH06841.1 metal-dependent hydrolase [Brachybacterium endophyticum]
MPELTEHEGMRGPRGERILVRRSPRRRRTVSITRREGDLVVSVPASFGARQERHWVRSMVEQLQRKENARGPARHGDDDLMRLAERLSQQHLDSRARPTSVSWSGRQRQRWGSCTSSTGEIRLSTRLRTMPQYVLEYVLVHELTHLLVDDHSAEFWAFVAKYPHTERARGFLDGVSYSQQHGPMDSADGTEDVSDDGVVGLG